MGLSDAPNLFRSAPRSVINSETLKEWLDRKAALLIDVREPVEFRAGHIPGAMLMPLSRFDVTKIISRRREKTIVLYCRSGHRSAMAAQLLANAGIGDVVQLSNGMNSWSHAGYPIQAG